MPEGNSSLYFSLGTTFLLLPTLDGVLDGVLFDDGQKVMPLGVSFNIIFQFRRPSPVDSLLLWHCRQFLTCGLLIRCT